MKVMTVQTTLSLLEISKAVRQIGVRLVRVVRKHELTTLMYLPTEPFDRAPEFPWVPADKIEITKV